MTFQLTPEQQAIVDAPLAPLRVAAGAGTGKTTTIVLRLKALLDGGIAPEAALGITFTNKAAAELADRLRVELPSLTADGREVQVSTYHGFAFLLLQEFGALVGVERDTKIIGPAHQRQLIQAALGETAFRHLDLTNPRHVGNKAFTLAGGVGDNLLTASEVLDATRDETGEVWEARRELLSIVDAYQASKQRLGVVDYSDLVARAHRLVTTYPEIGRRIRSRYRIVLLDEYQDTDPAQRELLRTIFGSGFPVTAVGDSDQTIYEWRGASRLNFDGFVEHFPNPGGSPAETLPLTLNRRSDRVILDLANLIRRRLHGDEPFEELRPGPGAGDGEIETAWLGTRDDEAAWIAGKIADAHEDGTPWNEIAVLFRTNADIAAVRRAATAAGIPTEVVSIGGLLDVPEVVDLLAWLRILEDPSDRTALTRILGGGQYRLGLGDLAPLAAWAAGAADGGTAATLIDAIEALDRIDGRSPVAAARLEAFRVRYRRLLTGAQHAPIQDLCRAILDATDAWIEIDALEEHAALSARLNLYRFLDLAETWRPLTGRPDLGSFLEFLDLLDEESAPTELDTATIDRGAAVSLSTIHRAKGLEWDLVVIPSVVEGTFPSGPRSYANPVDKPEYLPYRLRLDAATLPDLSQGSTQKERNAILKSYHEAEEWRIAYVAVTRARRRLVLTGSHRTVGRKSPRVPSPLFDLAAGIAAANTTVDDPGPIDPPPWTPDAPAPDPLFGPDGWIGALRSASEDPAWLSAYGEHAAGAEVAARQMRLDIASLPRPERPERPVAKATSVTGLVTLARCPLQFRWAFVDRLPTRPSSAMQRGVAFHRALELHNIGKVPLDDFADAAYDGPAERDDAPPPVTPPIDVFFASPYADRRARFAEVPIDLRFGGVRVRGRIDAVYEPEPGTWDIVDYKSGRPSDDPALDVQLETYAIAAVDGAVATPVPDRMTVTFAFFGGGALVERSVEVDDAWLAAARDRIDRLAAMFAADDYEPTPSEACRRCDFASFCEAGKAYLGR